MQHVLRNSACVFALSALALFVQFGVAGAQESTEESTQPPEVTTTASSNLTLLESLMKQIAELQKRLAELRGEVEAVRAELRADLKEGQSGDDVRKVQELLASDPTLYPEGLKSGYFGPLTREAIKRFQLRHELEATGVMTEETRALLEEYLSEAGNGGVPPGFLRAPGIQQKVEMRFVEGCENKGQGKAAFCNKVKMKWKMDDGKTEVEVEVEDESEDDSSDDAADVAEEIAEAEAALAALESAIEDATNATKISRAEAAVAAAEARLALAATAADAEAFDRAERQAKEALKIVKRAYKELTGTEYEDASDDSDDDDEDEDEDEDDDSEDDDDDDDDDDDEDED